MKKIFSLLLGLFLLSSIVLAKTTYSYDKYGAKTGSYRSTSSGYNSYDKYGAKTGSYRSTSSGYNSYDKYGQLSGTCRFNL